jgi:hypothetical protein
MKNTEEIQLLNRIRGNLGGLMAMPILGHTSERANAWRGIYERQGLNFAQSKEDAVTLRNLTAGGYMKSTGGRTKASAWRMTWKGIIATDPPEEPLQPASDILVNLGMLIEMEEPAGRRSGLPESFKVVYGYRLAPEALDWMKGGDPEAYTNERGFIVAMLFPLQALGWATVYTDGSGTIWAVCVTDSGRAVLNADLPDLNLVSSTHFDYNAWEPNFDAGFTLYSDRKPPSDIGLTRRLSTGGAWEDFDKKTKAELKAELKAATLAAVKRVFAA